MSVALTPIAATYAAVQDAKTPHSAVGFAYATKSENVAYLEFDTTALGDEPILYVVLELTTRTTGTTKAGVRVSQAPTGWDPNGLVWGNRPDGAHLKVPRPAH